MIPETIEDFIAKHSADKPGFDNLIFQLSTLVSTHSPPFIYINDPETPRIAAAVVDGVLSELSNPLFVPLTSHKYIRYARVNAVACFTPRLLYDSVLNSLANWRVSWDNNCENWSPDGEKPTANENLDNFLHGLRAIRTGLIKSGPIAGRKGQGGVKAQVCSVRMVVLIERAERLKESMPDLIVPLTRLAEFSQVEISVIFMSDMAWEDIRPPLGASPDPYYIDIQRLDKQATIQRLMSYFDSSSNQSSVPKNQIYHPTLRPLYEHFVALLYSICSPFTKDPDELAYISAARWPGFVQPVVDDHRRIDVTQDDAGALNLETPNEDVRMRLTRLFTPSLTAALEALYPRLTTAADWAKDNMPERNLLSSLSGNVAIYRDNVNSGMDSLPRMSKYILIAAFLASTNPAKSDLRMFGRGPDERKKVRRKIGTKTTSDPTSVHSRLLGPSPFPLDRLIAILGVLLEENDVDTRLPAPEFTIPGEYTEMEISRVHVYALVVELTSIHLLHRVSPSDKLDGLPIFKCAVPYDVVLALSRQLHVPLNDLLL